MRLQLFNVALLDDQDNTKHQAAKRWIDAVNNLGELGQRIDLAEYDRRTAALDDEIVRITTRATAPAPLDAAAARQWLDRLGDSWTSLPMPERRVVLVLLRAEITVNTGERPVWIELAVPGIDKPIRESLLYVNR